MENKMSRPVSQPVCSAPEDKTPEPHGNTEVSAKPASSLLRYEADYTNPSAAPAPKTIHTRKTLAALEAKLRDSDWQILEFIRMCKAASGNQLGRMFFHDRKNDHAMRVATNRALKNLASKGLLKTAGQKVINARYGYIAYIYYLSDAGERIIRIHRNAPETKKRALEPNMGKLTHTLAVAECYVQTVEACREPDMRLVHAEVEPACWRPFMEGAKQFVLMPDLALTTEKQDWMDHDEAWYELRWFIEVDLNTECIQTILEKCRRYYRYYRTDIEQRLHDDMFPLVVWIVKTEGRKDTILTRIQEEFAGFPKIFAVITADEYTKLLRDEIGRGCLCPN